MTGAGRLGPGHVTRGAATSQQARRGLLPPARARAQAAAIRNWPPAHPPCARARAHARVIPSVPPSLRARSAHGSLARGGARPKQEGRGRVGCGSNGQASRLGQESSACPRSSSSARTGDQKSSFLSTCSPPPFDACHASLDSLTQRAARGGRQIMIIIRPTLRAMPHPDTLRAQQPGGRGVARCWPWHAPRWRCGRSRCSAWPGWSTPGAPLRPPTPTLTRPCWALARPPLSR